MAVQITVEDIAALRKQGSFRDFLRLQFAPELITEQRPAPEPEVVVPAPGHRPGAWPTGTRPPERNPVGTSAQWEHAVTAYRRWLAAGSPSGDFTCECGCTPRRLR